MKHSKIRLLCALGVSTLALTPVLGLTSCGNISQWYLPVVTGGSSANVGPYKTLLTGNTFKDLNNKDLDYLQSNYSYYLEPSTSNSTTTAYSFTKPHDLSYVEDPDNISFLDQGWYDNANVKLTTASYSIKDQSDPNKKTNYLDSYNMNLATNAQAISTITSNASQFISYMLYYQLHLVNGYNGKDLTKLNQLYGDEINVGSKGQDTYTNFFEFNYDLANLLSDSKSKVKFGQSSCNIDIFSKLNEKGLGFLTYYGAQDHKDPSGADVTGDMLDPDYAYAINKADPDDQSKTIVSSYRYIPFLFNIEDLTFNYYNPVTSDKSFLPNNWLITDQESVNKKVKASKEWNNFKTITGVDKQISSLDWKVNLNKDHASLSTNGLKLSDHAANEPTIKNYLNDNNLSPSTFVGLASYGIDTITNDDGTTKTTTKYPVFNSVAGIYPISLLKDDDIFEQKDTNDDVWFLNKDKLDKKMNSLVKFYTDRNAKPDSELNCTKYLFSSFASNKWTADISKIITK